MDLTKLKHLVARRHPKYKAMVEHWDFLESCYKGGREWFTKENIFKYVKEGNKEFKDRLKRAYRFNHSREIVDLVNKYLFRPETIRKTDDAPECVKKFWLKSTLSGLDIKEFMQSASIRSSVFGRSWVVVDTDIPANDGKKISKLEASKYHGPYVYLVRPQDALDMSFGDDGQLNWILLAESVRDDADAFTSTGQISTAYRLWTRTAWYLIKSQTIPAAVPAVKVQGATMLPVLVDTANWAITDQGVHNLGCVPVLQDDSGQGGDLYSSPSLIADIAYLDRACANYASNLDAIIQDQTFSQLAMPAQNVLPGDDAYNTMLAMGTKRVFLYDGEGGAQPAFLSPDPRQAQLIISAIGQLINEIYHSVGLAGERTKQDNSKGIDNSSGVAKSKDFERVLALLKSKATNLENLENKIVRMVCKWSGETEPKDLVIYSDNFSVASLADEIAITSSIMLLDAPELVLSKQMKILLRKLLPATGDRELIELDKAADDWAKEQKEKSALIPEEGVSTGKLLDESRRDRSKAGEKQSKTKQRDTAA